MALTSYQTLLDYSFRLFTRKSYSEAEITQRLSRRANKLKLPEPEAALAKVLARLKELNYINDRKILENYFEYRLKTRPQGKFLFLHEMHRRGISFDKAKEAWDSRNIDEEALAMELLSRKAKVWVGLPFVLRKRKAAQFLASRGFSADTVWGVTSAFGGSQAQSWLGKNVA